MRWRRAKFSICDPERLVFYNLMTNEAVSTHARCEVACETTRRIAAVADLIRAGDFPREPGFGCSHCDYKPLCPAHEQLISIRPGRCEAVPRKSCRLKKRKRGTRFANAPLLSLERLHRFRSPDWFRA